jgi:predicted ATP-binding protein involved in virulence
MYIKKVVLENIRSISRFEMNFSKPAGWHVLIGDNGSGKTSVVQAIGLALMGSAKEIYRLKKSGLDTFLKQNTKQGKINIDLLVDEALDFQQNTLLFSTQKPEIELKLLTEGEFVYQTDAMLWLGSANGWFSTGFGPFRRFSGGEKLKTDNSRKSNFKSLFGEEHALAEALDWFIELDYQRLKENEVGAAIPRITRAYNSLVKFINESQLLPYGAKIVQVGLEGIIFQDGNGNKINVLDLSDGYRSILSLTFELIRQMVNAYGSEAVFQDINQGKMEINLPGVVLIDEIDAHLHPSWQVKIGKWFQQYFPQLQFIVTTHSPLICRACEKGSIWRLAAPGSEEESGEITGAFRERLIHGNILDAYGTEVFGKETVRSAESDEKLARLGHLNMLKALGKISTEDEKERLKLQKTLPTDAATGFTALATK